MVLYCTNPVVQKSILIFNTRFSSEWYLLGRTQKLRKVKKITNLEALQQNKTHPIHKKSFPDLGEACHMQIFSFFKLYVCVHSRKQDHQRVMVDSMLLIF